MYFLERREHHSMPNVLGNCSMPVKTYRWKIIAKCEEKEPLQECLAGLDETKHRITNNLGEE